jgi:tetratricopeptide (TPR) repeat protein
MVLRVIADWCWLMLGILVLGAPLAGCASAYSHGEEAFHAGRYQEAAAEFEAAAMRGPRRLDALTALGVSRHKLGDLIGAQEVLRSVLAEDAGLGEARLYLAIVALRRHEDARALEELGALRPQIHHPRIAAAVERAMATIPEGLSESVRRLVAASLDDAVEWARDVREASRLPSASLREPSWRVYRDRYRPLFP